MTETWRLPDGTMHRRTFTHIPVLVGVLADSPARAKMNGGMNTIACRPCFWCRLESTPCVGAKRSTRYAKGYHHPQPQLQ